MSELVIIIKLNQWGTNCPKLFTGWIFWVPTGLINMKERKKNRLKLFNYYKPGKYFVTFGTKNKNPYFGKIIKQKLILNYLGKIAFNNWLIIPQFYSNITLDAFMIMPEHIHGIISIIHPTQKKSLNGKIQNLHPTQTNLSVRTAYDAVHNTTQADCLNKNNGTAYYACNTTQADCLNKNNGTAYYAVPTTSYGLLSKIIKSYKHATTQIIKSKFPHIQFEWHRSFYDHIIKNTTELNNIRRYIINNPKNYAT
jgi:putative transposase